MNHSSPNHHRPTTKSVTGAGHRRHHIGAQTGWDRTKLAPVTDPLPDYLAEALAEISSCIEH
ncbi:MAG: hypothetical protein QOC69_3118 [Mycobacterium sp.]|jgi:hypothetical protein|nr:hypothetical protein [Mycobacterium sp.]